MRRPLLVLLTLLALPAFAEVRWRGDFETGDLKQWKRVQMVNADRLQVVSDPVQEGSHALKVTVHQGDNPIGASGNRNELVGPAEPEGSEAYFRWGTMFAKDFPSEHTWQLFAQWHQPEDCCGSPPIQFEVSGEELMFTVSTAQTLVWRAPLVRGEWHDFILHVKFSDDPKKGFVELWYDGKKAVEKTYAATRGNSYMKLGLYRNSTVRGTGVLYHDGMIRGDTLEDVLGALPGSAPAPAVAAGGGGNGSGSATALTGSSGDAPQAGGCSTGTGAPSLAALGLVGWFALRRRRARGYVRS